MRQRPTIVLHFGLAKTGTSALQEFLLENKRALLAKHAVLFPGQEANHYHLQSMFSDAPASLIQVRRAGLSRAQEVAAFLDDYRAGFERELLSTAADVVILSSEYFPSMTGEELQRLHGYLREFADRIVTVGYVRDPWSFAVSLSQQMLRDGVWTVPVGFGYSESNLELLDKMAGSFPGEMIVKPYVSPPGHSMDIVASFLDAVGLQVDPGLLDKPRPRRNEGLGYRAAALVGFLNGAFPQYDQAGNYLNDPVRDWVLDAIIEACRSDDVPIVLSAACVERIYEKARGDVETLETRFFGGERPFTRLYEVIRNTREGVDSIVLDSVPREVLARVLVAAATTLSQRAHWAAAHGGRAIELDQQPRC